MRLFSWSALTSCHIGKVRNILQRYQSPSLWLLVIMGCMLVAATVLQHNTYLSHDVSWHLLETQRFLQGGTYRNNFMDIGPPIIIYTLIPPVLMAKFFAISLLEAVRIYTFSLFFLSITCSFIVLRRLFQKNHIILNTLLINLTFILLLLPVNEFGQTEHLMLLLTLPYYFSIVSLAEKNPISPKLRVIISILAGIGFLIDIKVWFIYSACELYLIFYSKSFKSFFRKESLIILFITSIYIISMMIYTPDYLHFVLPLVWFLYMSAYNIPWTDMLFSLTSLSYYACVLAYGLVFQKTRQYHLLTVLFITNTIFFISYLMTRKLWYYHELPVLAFSLMILCVVFIEALDQKNFKNNVVLSIGITIYTSVSILLLPFHMYLLNQLNYYQFSNPHKRSILQQLINTTRKLAHHQPVYAFSIAMWQGSLITYADTDYASRFNTLWMLPGLLQKEHQQLNQQDTKKYRAALTIQRDMLALDLYHYRPAIIIVNNTVDSYYANVTKIDYIAFFSQNQCFRNVWQHYHYLVSMGNYHFYQIKKSLYDSISCDQLAKNRS